MRKEVRSKKRQQGLTLLELALVLVAGSLLFMLVFTINQKLVAPNNWTTTKLTYLNRVIAAVEQAKVVKGGVYPASSAIDLGTSNTPAELVNVLQAGGSRTDLTNWKYSCNSGTLTIQMWVGDRPSNEVASALASQITNNFGYTATYTAGQDTIDITRSGVICQ